MAAWLHKRRGGIIFFSTTACVLCAWRRIGIIRVGYQDLSQHQPQLSEVFPCLESAQQ